jgi:hypothetical protein
VARSPTPSSESRHISKMIKLSLDTSPLYSDTPIWFGPTRTEFSLH